MGVGGAREMGVGGAREMGVGGLGRWGWGDGGVYIVFSLLSIHFYPNSR